MKANRSHEIPAPAISEVSKLFGENDDVTSYSPAVAPTNSASPTPPVLTDDEV